MYNQFLFNDFLFNNTTPETPPGQIPPGPFTAMYNNFIYDSILYNGEGLTYEEDVDFRMVFQIRLVPRTLKSIDFQMPFLLENPACVRTFSNLQSEFLAYFRLVSWLKEAALQANFLSHFALLSLLRAEMEMEFRLRNPARLRLPLSLLSNFPIQVNPAFRLRFTGLATWNFSTQLFYPLKAHFLIHFGYETKSRVRPWSHPGASFLFASELFSITDLPWAVLVTVGTVDLSSRVRSVSIRFAFDAGAWTAEIEFTNPLEWVQEGRGLAPWDPVSLYNKPRPLLGVYNPVRIRFVRAGTVRTIFEGYIGPAEVSAGEQWGAADTVRITCVGISQPLKDWMIEGRLALQYKKAVISPVGQPDLLNRICMDQGFPPVIKYKDDPQFAVEEYTISDVSLWEALQNALAPTGFRLVELYDEETGRFQIFVKDPLRTKAAPDWRFRGEFSVRNISANEADVRTYVGVVYRDRVDFQEKYVFAEASPQIVALYGIPDLQGGRKHRKMVYRTSERSLIDSESEARELANMILWDLETPSPNVEVRFPQLLFGIQPFDLIEVEGEVFATRFGVQEIEWNFSFDNPYGETVVTGAFGKIIGAKEQWFAKDVRREGVRAEETLTRVVQAPPFSQPKQSEVYGAFFVGPDGTPVPVVDVVFPGPTPHNVSDLVVSLKFLQRQEDGEVESASGNEVRLKNKNFPAGRYCHSYQDHLLVLSGKARGDLIPITSVSGNRVVLERAPVRPLAAGDRVVIARFLREERREDLNITRYTRFSGLREGDLVAVTYAWRPQSTLTGV